VLVLAHKGVVLALESLVLLFEFCDLTLIRLIELSFISKITFFEFDELSAVISGSIVGGYGNAAVIVAFFTSMFMSTFTGFSTMTTMPTSMRFSTMTTMTTSMGFSTMTTMTTFMRFSTMSTMSTFMGFSTMSTTTFIGFSMSTTAFMFAVFMMMFAVGVAVANLD
jgi:hypothetical protein